MYNPESVENGQKSVALGSVMYSGVLKRVVLDGMGKDQGWGNTCSFFTVYIKRGNQTIMQTSKDVERSMKQIYSDVIVPEGTQVQKGDTVSIILTGLYSGCAVNLESMKIVLDILQ
jgi:hypothetical protein